MGKSPVSIEFKDSSPPNLSIVQELQGLHSPGGGSWFVILAGCNWPLTVHAHAVDTRADSLNIYSAHPVCANAATGTSVLAPKLGRVELGILFPGTRFLTTSRGQPLGVPKGSRSLHPALLHSPRDHLSQSPFSLVLLGTLPKPEVSALPQSKGHELCPLLGLEGNIVIIFATGFQSQESRTHFISRVVLQH